MTAKVPANKSGSAKVFVLFAETFAVDSAVDSLAVVDLLLAIIGLVGIRLLCLALSSSAFVESAATDATTAVPFRARSPGACGVLTAELLGLLYQVGGPVVTAVVLAAVEPTTLSPLSPPPARAVAAPLIAVGEKRPL